MRTHKAIEGREEGRRESPTRSVYVVLLDEPILLHTRVMWYPGMAVLWVKLPPASNNMKTVDNYGGPREEWRCLTSSQNMAEGENETPRNLTRIGF